MKKSMLALAITALASTAWAQVSPSPTSPAAAAASKAVAPAPVVGAPSLSTQALPPLPTGANPFTGVTKAQSEIDRSEDELKRLRALSTQKLSLQRDELDALRIELDKKKILDALNPPKPVVIQAPAPAPVVKKAVVKVEKPAPTPPQIIAPAAAKYETPQVLGVIDVGGQKVAMMRFDGQTFRAASGSTVGGKPVANIEPNGVQWGTSFLTVASTASAPPSFVMTDDRTDPKNRVISAQTTASATPQVQPTATMAPTYGPTAPVTFSPQGATRSTSGASGPTGVLQLPPPPPTLVR